MNDSTEKIEKGDSPQRIGIVRFSALGDIVHTLPAFSLLRSTFPASHITWFVHPPGARLLASVNGIDTIEPVILKGIPPAELFRKLRQTLKHHRRRLDLVIDFQGLIKSGVFSALLGGRRLGFATADLREKAAGFCYNLQASPFPGRHVIDRNIHLLSALNIQNPAPYDYSLMVTRPDEQTAEGLALLKLADSGEKPICLINLGGNWPTKQFPSEFWIALLDHLSGRITPLLTWGTAAEKNTAETIAAARRVEIAPFLTFRQLIWLISRCRAVVSGDTLVLHLADAVGVPSLGLFGPTDPERNGSRHPESRWIRAEVPCGYCYRRECDKMWCTRNLSPIRAANLANEVIDR